MNCGSVIAQLLASDHSILTNDPTGVCPPPPSPSNSSNFCGKEHMEIIHVLAIREMTHTLGAPRYSSLKVCTASGKVFPPFVFSPAQFFCFCRFWWRRGSNPTAECSRRPVSLSCSSRLRSRVPALGDVVEAAGSESIPSRAAAAVAACRCRFNARGARVCFVFLELPKFLSTSSPV